MLRNPVTIAPLAEDNIEAARTLTVKPFQEVFSGQPIDLLSKSEAGISVHVIKKKDLVVGMFRVDTRFHFNHTFMQPDTSGIRNFIIDQNKQGQGLGTETCRMMPAYLRGVIPMARGVYLMMNITNAGAYKACIKGGWNDTGDKYTLGRTGPQHILCMPLR
ncbi:MAG: hypothetical protein JKY14_05670 [Paraglaciecola sp.]|nr:hypothetical protein [Paraglaciecola sp.]